MTDFKAAFSYKNGVLLNKTMPSFEGLSQQEYTPIIAIVGGIEFAMAHFPVKFKINGVIYFEAKDNELFIDYDITPDEAIQPIEQAIIGTYSRIQRK